MAASEKRLEIEKERNIPSKKNSDVNRDPYVHSSLTNTYEVNTHVLPDLGETEFMKKKFQ